MEPLPPFATVDQIRRHPGIPEMGQSQNKPALHVARQYFDEVHDLAAYRWILDPVEGRDKRPAFGRSGKTLAIMFRAGARTRLTGPAARTGIVDTFKEIADRNCKNGRDPMEPPCPDPVLTLLVFLDLLEGHTETLGDLPLAEAERISPPAQLAPDMHIDLVCRSHGNTLSEPDHMTCLNTPLAAL